MTAVEHNIVIDRGTTFREQLIWRQPNGLPVDLTGRTAKMQIRSAPGGEVVHGLTTENGGITLGASAGTIDLYIPATTTREFPKKHLEYDLLVIQTADEVDPIVRGEVRVDLLVTEIDD